MNRRERRLAEKQERKRRKQSRRSIEVRNDVPISLLADREVRSAVRETCQELRQLLGPSCQFIAEQVVEPEDEFAEPRLFLLAAIDLANENAQEQLDRYIMDRWGAQSRRIRRLVRLGSELV